MKPLRTIKIEVPVINYFPGHHFPAMVELFRHQLNHYVLVKLLFIIAHG